uniref:CCZ1/INTU/HSP4 first Longin domain-containing protein n=1 Tax=Oncorhynchus mykiss TaxID=8022 RepID=A0A8K9X8M1_ONCMY
MLTAALGSNSVPKRYTSSLLSFFIYNPSFWPWEGEEKKILFYHPSEVEKNEKIRNNLKYKIYFDFVTLFWLLHDSICAIS